MSSYALDRRNAKILGVCAGLARSAGWDPTIVRIGALALTLFALGPLLVVFYIAVGAFAPAE
ncbi:MAG TPA: PspC domain-containing protein [Allosphingosinicella sp.]|nr:PspC domain-containing protein [Allosphingosinicella sp.]